MAPLSISNLFNFSANADISNLEMSLPDVNNPVGMSSLETDVTYILDQQPLAPFKMLNSWANIWINSVLIACLWLILAFIAIKGKINLAKIKSKVKGHFFAQTDETNPENPATEPLRPIDTSRPPMLTIIIATD